jgi:hypothetical protein
MLGSETVGRVALALDNAVRYAVDGGGDTGDPGVFEHLRAARATGRIALEAALEEIDAGGGKVVRQVGRIA